MNRKGFFSTPQNTGGSNSTTKPIMRHTPHNTHKTLTKPNIRHELTFLDPTQIVNTEPSIDWELECDFAHNDYLQALALNEVIENNIKSKQIKLNDQLSIKNEFLIKSQDTKRKLEFELNHLKVKQKLEKVVKDLLEISNKFMKYSKEYNLENNLNTINNELEEVYNSVELKNVKSLKTQEEYDQLLNLIKECNEEMLKITLFTNNVENLDELSAVLKKCVDLKESVMTYIEQMEVSEEKISYLTLEYVSDKFANLQ